MVVGALLAADGCASKSQMQHAPVTGPSPVATQTYYPGAAVGGVGNQVTSDPRNSASASASASIPNAASETPSVLSSVGPRFTSPSGGCKDAGCKSCR